MQMKILCMSTGHYRDFNEDVIFTLDDLNIFIQKFDFNEIAILMTLSLSYAINKSSYRWQEVNLGFYSRFNSRQTLQSFKIWFLVYGL